MKLYQISIKGSKPCGGLFETRQEAEREIGFLKADDRRHAQDAMREAGVQISPVEYEIHEINL